MAVFALPEGNLKVLEYLGIYRFLTVPQFQKLGIAAHGPSVYRVLKRFADFPQRFVEQKKFGFLTGIGNLHSVYYLTRQGAELVAEIQGVELDEIPYPKGVQVFERDYFHRIFTVDFQISLRQWAERTGATVDFFDTYFDKLGSNRSRDKKNRLRAKTRVDLSGGFFIPDAIYLYTESSGKQELFALEIHNGTDTGRFLKQMEPHIQALEEGAIPEKYRLRFDNRVAWIFEHRSTMNGAIRRIRERKDLEALREHLVFNDVQSIADNFAKGWEQF